MWTYKFLEKITSISVCQGYVYKTKITITGSQVNSNSKTLANAVSPQQFQVIQLIIVLAKIIKQIIPPRY